LADLSHRPTSRGFGRQGVPRCCLWIPLIPADMKTAARVNPEPPAEPLSIRRTYFESFAAPVTASPADDTSRPTPSTVLHALIAKAPATTAKLKNFRILTSEMRRVDPLPSEMSHPLIRSGSATHRHCPQKATRRLSPTGFCRGHTLSRDGSYRLALGPAGELNLSQRLGSHYPCRSWLGGVS